MNDFRPVPKPVKEPKKRKRMRNWVRRAKTTLASAYLEAVKWLNCAICEAPPPSDAHHPRSGSYGGKRASDFLTIPLCKRCHVGPEGFHMRKKTWERRHGPDTGYIRQTQKAVKEATGIEVPEKFRK